MRWSAPVLIVCLAAACGQESPVAPDRVPPDEDGRADASLDRATWVVREITRWNQGLLPEVRAEKFQEMAKNPFAFFRGTNHLFWADHVRDPRLGDFADAGTFTFLAGYVHPENFGAYD